MVIANVYRQAPEGLNTRLGAARASPSSLRRRSKSTPVQPSRPGPIRASRPFHLSGRGARVFSTWTRSGASMSPPGIGNAQAASNGPDRSARMSQMLAVDDGSCRGCRQRRRSGRTDPRCRVLGERRRRDPLCGRRGRRMSRPPGLGRTGRVASATLRRARSSIGVMIATRRVRDRDRARAQHQTARTFTNSHASSTSTSSGISGPLG
jgi:hypothetical protein